MLLSIKVYIDAPTVSRHNSALAPTSPWLTCLSHLCRLMVGGSADIYPASDRGRPRSPDEIRTFPPITVTRSRRSCLRQVLGRADNPVYFINLTTTWWDNSYNYAALNVSFFCSRIQLILAILCAIATVPFCIPRRWIIWLIHCPSFVSPFFSPQRAVCLAAWTSIFLR